MLGEMTRKSNPEMVLDLLRFKRAKPKRDTESNFRRGFLFGDIGPHFPEWLPWARPLQHKMSQAFI